MVDKYNIDSEYSRLAMRILEEIRKEYPTTTANQIDEILNHVRDWVGVMTVSWTTDFLEESVES